VTATISGVGGTLIGSTTATALSGVATFTGLGIDGNNGTTYTITYTVSGLTVATVTVTLIAPICDGITFTCQVGDTGPGGGKIFYVADTFFTQLGASGSMCTNNCKYLEAAPTSGTNAWTDAKYVWSGKTTEEATAAGTAIGTGYANTLAIFGQANTANRAATKADAYAGPNNLSDWFLPSKDELNQMCKWQSGDVLTSDATVVCTGAILNSDTNGASSAGFRDETNYWSSTEFGSFEAWAQYFGSESRFSDAKNVTYYVRPIRAF
jgi:hypothetical protein